MTRYLQFNDNYHEFSTRADVSIRKEYFERFTFGGTRDKKLYALTRIRPEVTVEYQVIGGNFFYYAMGKYSTIPPETNNTITVGSTLPLISIKIDVDGDKVAVKDGKIDSMEITFEEGSPAVVEYTVLGKNWDTTTSVTAYTVDWDKAPLTMDKVTITLNDTTVQASRIAVRIANNLDPRYFADTLPVELRETGLEVTGRIRISEYEVLNDGTLKIDTEFFTMTLPNIKFTELPPRVTGFDVPEAELAFTAYPAKEKDVLQVVTKNAEW